MYECAFLEEETLKNYKAHEILSEMGSQIQSLGAIFKCIDSTCLEDDDLYGIGVILETYARGLKSTSDVLVNQKEVLILKQDSLGQIGFYFVE